MVLVCLDANTEKIYRKIPEIICSENQEVKQEIMQEVVELMNALNEDELFSLMSDSNELVRSLSARAYAGKTQSSSFDNFKEMLSNDNDNIRDSAVISLCYLNSPESLSLLDDAANDHNYFIKLRALTGIADIAFEYANSQAKEILQKFLDTDDERVRSFVSDELSLLS